MNQVSKKYDFNSVGTIVEDVASGILKKSEPIPFGIKTPMELGGTEQGIFKMTTSPGDQVHDNFRNLLLTNHGERLGFYDFGANLEELTHELGSENGDALAINRIRNAVSKYMPYISLKTFEAYTDHAENDHVAKVKIRVVYEVPSLGVSQKAMEITMFVTG